MKHSSIIGWLFCVCIFFGWAELSSAQGTTFTYQGRLTDGNSPANGNYDLKFTLFNSPSLVIPIVAGPITNSAVAVTNGVFTVELDFGPNVFTGTNYWLEIAVRLNSTLNFSTLSPRQPLTPTPYAIFANSASNLLGNLPSTQLTGTLPSAQIGGTYAGAVIFNNGANNFIGAFNGNGSSLSNLDASQLANGTVSDARLSSNVALLDGDQIFTGVNTFTNFQNSFRGSFFGNGLVGWIPTNGTVVQGVRDSGYMLISSLFTTVTLPPTVTLTPGDIMRVSGTGSGGWQIKENSGQFIMGDFGSYHNGYLAALATAVIGTDLHGVAGSADGVRLYAVGNGITGVYASSNSGQTWSQVSGTSLSGPWFSVACSANGKIVYAEPYAGGIIQKSSDYGATWSPTASSASGTFISCSADGSTLFPNNNACSGNGTYLGKVSGGVITISTNGGSTFNIAVTAPAVGVTCLGVSSDCTRLVAGINGGRLYASSNLGATWTTLTSTNQVWSGAWMSPDGSKFAATVSVAGSIPGGVYYCNVNVLPNTSSTTSTGSIFGSQGSAVELQYIGNSQFMPVSLTGIIWAN